MKDILEIGVIAAGLTLTAFTPLAAKEPTKDWSKTLSGVWEIKEGVTMGRPMTEQEKEGATIVVDKDAIVTYDADKNELYRAKYSIDASAQPMQINMVTDMKGQERSIALGIVKMNGDDRWSLAYALPGNDRPTQFQSPTGSKVMYFKLRRDESQRGLTPSVADADELSN
ncbi:TIGR03067 domain-containing protein [Crateriforma conspicua]|uniref:TIGR03067 domain-containing protein n=1 Tax=Crateriforma conspicua TaxID=2527996 RepID=A0A5C5Y2P2_9PLAN|nr:TIGR03067 domain-containing protein [Crateriforma conspicua]TWT68941.1 hypothetical protein Pan14r_12250 [Crateriforma conspicua]